MTAAGSDTAALLRGGAVGFLTTTLAVAAHGLAGGGVPGGAVAVQLTLLAMTLGLLAVRLPAARRAAVLWALLGSGQLLSHALLATAGHQHDVHILPAPAMLVMHLVAVTLGAGMIACGARLLATVSRVVAAVSRPARIVPRRDGAARVRSADQPLQSVRLLTASVSHRGPPVGHAF